MRWHLILIGTFLLGMATLAQAETCRMHYVYDQNGTYRQCQTCCLNGNCITNCW
jgi:hypothetical protein